MMLLPVKGLYGREKQKTGISMRNTQIYETQADRVKTRRPAGFRTVYFNYGSSERRGPDPYHAKEAGPFA
jgi:hypothetical protein